MPILTAGIGVNVPRGEEDEKKTKVFHDRDAVGDVKKTRDQFQPVLDSLSSQIQCKFGRDFYF